jgi:hypothetical protein
LLEAISKSGECHNLGAGFGLTHRIIQNISKKAAAQGGVLQVQVVCFILLEEEIAIVIPNDEQNADIYGLINLY